MERVPVKITSDSQFNDYKAGELGLVDGYIISGAGQPCVVVVLVDHIVMVPFHSVEVLKLK